MRIRLVSDLHTEFIDPNLSYNSRSHLSKLIGSISGGEVDVLVMAGDIATVDTLPRLLPLLDKGPWRNVLYVMGNHEYYTSDWVTARVRIREMCSNSQKVILLQNDVEEIDGIRFAGTTLWFPERPETILARSFLNDFRYLSAEQIEGGNRHALNFLESCDADVLITHHGVSTKSLDAKYERQGPINFFYYTDISNLILEKKFKYVFHGHVHCSKDYMIGDTRVITNPRGYPGMEYHIRPQNLDFDPNMIVQIDKEERHG